MIEVLDINGDGQQFDMFEAGAIKHLTAFEVFELSASEGSLEEILKRFSGIRGIRNGLVARITWYGDDAKFIWGNI